MKKIIFTILLFASFFCCYAENTNIEENQFKGTWECIDEGGDGFGLEFNNKYVLFYDIYNYDNEVEKEVDIILPYVHDENFVIIFDEDSDEKIYGYIENSILFIEGEQLTKEKKEDNIFPKLFVCATCSKQLKVTKPGRFRCSECKSILSVDSQGKMSLE